MQIVLGADHGGFDLKEAIREKLLFEGRDVSDVGCFSRESVDYPDFAEQVVRHIIDGECQRGILICGTGIGMSIAANRHFEIRAANCYDEYTAKMSREHNDSNILCVGARVLEKETALHIVDVWLQTEFAGGRHLRRISKFSGN
ncbi:MAG: ribose 5-phosphate isomerase B [Desulforhopalus sp.]